MELGILLKLMVDRRMMQNTGSSMQENLLQSATNKSLRDTFQQVSGPKHKVEAHRRVWTTKRWMFYKTLEELYQEEWVEITPKQCAELEEHIYLTPTHLKLLLQKVFVKY